MSQNKLKKERQLNQQKQKQNQDIIQNKDGVIKNKETEIEKLKNQVEEEKKRADARVQQRVAGVTYKRPQATSGVEQWRPLVAKYFPANQVDNALLTMSRESGGNPRAVSRTNDHGLFQINGGLQTYGEKIYDPEFNVSLAYNHYFKNRGWTPWCAVRGILWS